MADDKKSVTTFTYVINHYLSIKVRDNKVIFDEADQKIYLMGFKIQPAMELVSAEALIYYPNGTDIDIIDALRHVVNVTARTTPNKTVKTAGTALAADATTPSYTKQEDKINEAQSVLPDMELLIISEQLDISSQVENKSGTFTIITKSSQIPEFITHTRSKKIKVFINNKEFAPKYEMELIKRIFPQIELTVHVK